MYSCLYLLEGGVSTCFGEVGGVGAGGVVKESSVTVNSTRKPQAGGPVKRKPEGGRTEDRPRVKEAGGSHLHAHHSIVCSIGVRAHIYVIRAHIYVLTR